MTPLPKPALTVEGLVLVRIAQDLRDLRNLEPPPNDVLKKKVARQRIVRVAFALSMALQAGKDGREKFLAAVHLADELYREGDDVAALANRLLQRVDGGQS